MSNQKKLYKNSSGLTPYLTPLAAWALAFGCSVGWGSFVMPGTTFLPIAGPVGSALGLLIGAAFMLVIGVNYSRLMKRYPDTGGAFTYTKNILGGDHGFLCAWMMLLTYIAIIWANATAVSLIARYLFGDVLCFGFSYEIAGYTIHFGEMLASFCLIVFSCLVCSVSKRLSKWVQTIAAVLLFGGIAACFVAVVIHCGGFSAMEPYFQEGSDPIVQILGIVILAPWAFIGFESISHSAGEFRFKLKKTFPIIIAALVTGVLSYVMLSVCASMARPDGYANWMEYIGDLASHNGIEALPTFYSAKEAMGDTGLLLLGIAALCGIITGMIGNTIALSRLVYTLSKENMMPSPFKKLNKFGLPWVAICVIGILSCVILFFGRTAIGWIVDVTTIGATIVYAYVSICNIALGIREKRKSSVIIGSFGALSAFIVIVIYMIPNMSSLSQLPTESYLILTIWCVLGVLVFRMMLQRDKSREYGHKFIVWVILFALILLVSVVWINKLTIDEATKISSDVQTAHMQDHIGEQSADEELHDTLQPYVAERIVGFGDFVSKNIYIFALFTMFLLFVIFSIFSLIKRREQEMDEQRLIALEHSRAKSSFLSNMSHDIRTPLNAVTGYTMLALEEEDMPEKVRTYLKKIDFSSKHLLTLINDILDMSRIESGKVEMEYSPIDLCALFDEVSEIFALQMQSKGIEFRVDYEDIDDRYIICDKNRLLRILMNLISNAYKFTPEGGTVSAVARQTGLDQGNACYELIVSDTGIGMSKEFQEHVFDAFERERSSTVSKLEGTGLGMSIVKSFVEMMGGTIDVESEQNKGTSFIINLVFPITTKDQVKDVLDTSDKEAVDFTGKRLLLVEDNIINAEIAREILSGVGFEIDIAENGKIAVEMVEAAEPDHYCAILMDVMMPVMNGYEATRAIRELDSDRASIPIIALSANSFESDKKEAIGAGMNAHVSKPFNPDELITKISEIMQ